MKECISCGVLKPKSEFHKDKSRSTGLRERCKDCRCKHPKKVVKNCIACNDLFEVSGNRKGQKYCGETCQKVHLKYGIDEYKLEDLLIQSDYKCHICGEYESSIDPRTGKEYSLAIDHNHETGEVRGVLCSSCNVGIGLLKDDVGVMANAIKYIIEHGGKACPSFDVKSWMDSFDCA